LNGCNGLARLAPAVKLRLLVCLIALGYLPAAGCGSGGVQSSAPQAHTHHGATVDPRPVEKSIRAGFRRLLIPIKSVSCPSGIKIRRGRVFHCQADGRAGLIVVTVKIFNNQRANPDVRVIDFRSEHKPGATSK
jgi:uncharacterized protein DUF4333